MKKKSIKTLELNKKSISNFQEKLNGGRIASVSTIITGTLTDITNVIMCYTYRDESMCWE